MSQSLTYLVFSVCQIHTSERILDIFSQNGIWLLKEVTWHFEQAYRTSFHIKILKRTQLYRLRIGCKCIWKPEPVFVDLLRWQGIDSQPGGQYDKPIWRSRLHRGWRNRFFSFDSWAPQTFTNSGSSVFHWPGRADSLYNRACMKLHDVLNTK